MSNSEAPSELPIPTSRDEDSRAPDDIAAADHTSPESLWKPGRFTFIDDEVKTDAEQTIRRAQSATRMETDGIAPPNSTNGDPQPAVPTAETTAEQTPTKQRAKRAQDLTMARPDWLPEGWGMDCRVRASGASAGSMDRYYLDPVSGARFRSKKEVYHFLETGNKKLMKRKPDGDVTPSVKSGGSGRKKKNSGSVAKLAPPPNFNFDNPPKEVCWVLTNASTDTWTPFVGSEAMRASTKQEWVDAFEYLNSQKGHAAIR